MTTQAISKKTTGSGKTAVTHRGTGGGCSCGCGEVAPTPSYDATCGCNDGLLVQPHFFAGQLLTDDDLQALTDYVINRHRLHNRFVVGSGVSCGLAVTCHPCNHGKVIVQPGYAIDCCGRDIMVPCAVELDINAMVREMVSTCRRIECEDPCMKKKEDDKDNQKKWENHYKPVDRYCLYLHYCEQPTDPVTPYSQDESCAATCQPTRIREGFRFELRCPEVDEPPPSLVDRIKCCVGFLDEADYESRNLERLECQMEKMKAGVESYSQRKQAEFADEDANLIFKEAVDPDGFEAGVRAYRSKREKGAIGSAGDDLRNERALRESLDKMQSLGSAVARYELLSDEQKKEWDKNREGLSDMITTTRDLLNNSMKLREKVIVHLTSEVEMEAAYATLDNTFKYSVNSKTKPKERQTLEAYIYAYNASCSPALVYQINSAMASFKNWLLRKMCECPPTTECLLYEEVSSVVIPTGTELNEAMYCAMDILIRALIRYLLDCICAALIPPCPTCEDPAVKLACLEVIDCRVDNICNLERTFLLTEHNLRYWLPFLHSFGEALERLCCEFSKKFDQPIIKYRSDRTAAVVRSQPDAQKGYFSSGLLVLKSLEAKPAYHTILRIIGLSPDTVRPTINIGNSLTNIALRQPQFTDQFARWGLTESVAEPAEMLQGKSDLQEFQEKMMSEVEAQKKEIQNLRAELAGLKKGPEKKSAKSETSEKGGKK